MRILTFNELKKVSGSEIAITFSINKDYMVISLQPGEELVYGDLTFNGTGCFKDSREVNYSTLGRGSNYPQGPTINGFQIVAHSKSIYVLYF